MAVWISTQEFMDKTGLSHSGARKVINQKRYKKQPIAVDVDKNRPGKPAYLVAWNSETNAPATENDLQSSPSYAEQPLASTDAGTFLGDKDVSSNVVPIIKKKPSVVVDSTENQVVANVVSDRPLASASRDDEPDASVVLETQAAAVLQDENLDVEEPKSESEVFETLLYRFLLDKKISTRKTLRSRYRKVFRETGEIPQILIGKESRGRRSTLDAEIAVRFIAMTKDSVELNEWGHVNVTHSLRKVTNFHYELEKEFKRDIDIQKLYALVHKHKLKKYFNKLDGEEQAKEQSYFLGLPVLHTIQMDGVQTDYFAVRKDPTKPITSAADCRFVDCIEFYDLGSRKLMAIDGYFGESNENSVDVFNKFILNNSFTETIIRITPDNAKGFLNLRHCIKAINDQHARPDGFTFLDCFARAGSPKDKAHLESSHRAFHSFEHHVIEHYKALGKVVGTFEKRKKINDSRYKIITCTMIDISLEEFKTSGFLEEYRHKHNSSRHRFSENGRQKSWIPDVKYDAHLKLHPVFNFTEEDALRNRVHGYTKQKATVSKDGLITYKTAKYSVPQDADFSSTNSTPVYIRDIGDGILAVLTREEDGQFICNAVALKAPVKSEKIIAIEEKKVAKSVAGGAYSAICRQFEAIALPINEKMLKDFIERGLTSEIAAIVISNNSDIKIGDGSDKNNGRRWLYFCSDATEILIENKDLRPKYRTA